MEKYIKIFLDKLQILKPKLAWNPASAIFIPYHFFCG